MKINNSIICKLTEANVDMSKALSYLFLLKHELLIDTAYYAETIKQIESLNIVVINYDNKTVDWITPLCNYVDNWSWVEELYIPMFKKANPDKIGIKKSVIKKMQDFFKEHPNQYKKEDVLNATQLYFEVNKDLNPKFIKQADYFISKVENGVKVSFLLEYLTRYEEVKNQVATKKHSVYAK